MAHILKPTLWKILLMLMLFFVFGAIWRVVVISRISDTFPIGFPFQFYLAWGPCQPGQSCSEFNGLFLLFDFIIWYVVSAFLVSRLRRTT